MKRTKWLVVILAVCLIFGCSNSGKPRSLAEEVASQQEMIMTDRLSGYVPAIDKFGLGSEYLVLASWNAGNFGKSKSAEIISYMAKVLKDADIVALQEVSTANSGAQAVAKLADELNRTGAKWNYTVSESTHQSASKERYAFLWKPSRVKTRPENAFLVEALKATMEREPGKMNFVAGDKKFSLVSVHLVPTARSPETEVEQIKYNWAKLAEENTILVGDFNLDHNRLDLVFEKEIGMTHWIESKTSLRMQRASDGDHLAREYDNIFTKGDFKVGGSSIVDFSLEWEDFHEARKVSDHLPVYIIFKP